MAVKSCLHCEQVKPLEDFPVDSRRRDGRRSHCNACNVQLVLAYQRLNPEGHIARSRRYRYDLTEVEYEAMLDRQDGKCAICLQVESSKKTKRLSVDHCHVSKRIRGLLCTRRNSILGFAGDDPAVLGRAIDYLEASSGS